MLLFFIENSEILRFLLLAFYILFLMFIFIGCLQARHVERLQAKLQSFGQLIKLVVENFLLADICLVFKRVQKRILGLLSNKISQFELHCTLIQFLSKNFATPPIPARFSFQWILNKQMSGLLNHAFLFAGLFF